jgi:hypothetical protein
MKSSGNLLRFFDVFLNLSLVAFGYSLLPISISPSGFGYSLFPNRFSLVAIR